MNAYIAKKKTKKASIKISKRHDPISIYVKFDSFILSDGGEIKTGKMFMENNIILN